MHRLARKEAKSCWKVVVRHIKNITRHDSHGNLNENKLGDNGVLKQESMMLLQSKHSVWVLIKE